MTEEGRMARRYRVAFLKRPVKHAGIPALDKVDTIDIDDADSAQDALSEAIGRIKLRHEIDDWRTIADRYRVYSLSQADGTGTLAPRREEQIERVIPI
jgi:hypothetical protein